MLTDLQDTEDEVHVQVAESEPAPAEAYGNIITEQNLTEALERIAVEPIDVSVFDQVSSDDAGNCIYISIKTCAEQSVLVIRPTSFNTIRNVCFIFRSCCDWGDSLHGWSVSASCPQRKDQHRRQRGPSCCVCRDTKHNTGPHSNKNARKASGSSRNGHSSWTQTARHQLHLLLERYINALYVHVYFYSHESLTLKLN